MDISEQHDVVWPVAEETRRYASGSLGWIAKQQSDEHDDLWGFIVGNGFAAVTVTEILQAKADKAEDALYRKLATEIMGYAPDSRQDLENRIDILVTRIISTSQQIGRLQAQSREWADLMATLSGKLLDMAGNDV